MEIELLEEWLDEWPPHAPAQTIQWSYPNTSTVLKTLSGWTRWTDDTYPGYPHIRQADPGRHRIDLPTSEIPSGSFDYAGFFNTTLPGQGQTPNELINSGEVDEVWIWADPTGRLHESVLAKPSGDGSTLHNISAPIEVPGLERRVSVLGLNYQRGSSSALHSFAHRVESMIARVLHEDPNGGIARYCSQVTGSNGPFFRIFNCYDNASPDQYFGAIGIVHRAFNSPDQPHYLNDLWAPDEVNFTNSEPTNEEEWYNYPNFSSSVPKPSKNCSEWEGCPQANKPFGDKEKYYRWLLDHVPRYEGMEGDTYNNLWPYVFRMSCFPEL